MADTYHRLTGRIELIVKTGGGSRQACDTAVQALDSIDGTAGITVLGVHVKRTPYHETGGPR